MGKQRAYIEKIFENFRERNSCALQELKNNPDALSRGEQIDLLNKEKVNRMKSDTRSRTILSYLTFAIISLWLIAVYTLLRLNSLSENVYITLLATTTANVIGLPAIVLRGYFKN